MTDKARILFVDDEKRVLNSMRGMFRREFDLFLTTEGAAAVKIASENSIDVIVADQRMPGMTGIEVLGKVRELSPDTIRILLTGYADPSAVEGSINVGEVFRFLGKPCSPKLLRETLNLAVTATSAARKTSRPERVFRAGEHAETRKSRPANGEIHDGAKTSSQRRSSTGIAVAADDRKELRDAYIASRAAVRAKEIGVVVYTVDAQFAETSIRALSTKRSTALATSLIKVIQTIERGKTGVLVTDITTNGALLQKIIGALKQYLPELVTIVASDDRDSTEMINLINYGQIFRYSLKPITPQQMLDDIDAAAAKHLDLRDNPESIRRHAVLKFPGQTDAPSALNRALGRIREHGSQRLGAKAEH